MRIMHKAGETLTPPALFHAQRRMFMRPISGNSGELDGSAYLWGIGLPRAYILGNLSRPEEEPIQPRAALLITGPLEPSTEYVGYF